MIFERDGIKVEEYQTMPDGRKWYQITRKTSHYTHISYITNVIPAQQNEADLLKLAKKRFRCQ